MRESIKEKNGDIKYYCAFCGELFFVIMGKNRKNYPGFFSGTAVF